MSSGDEIRDGQRAAWAGLSAGWEKWDAVIMDQLGPVGTAMIERLEIADDQQHLDIASPNLTERDPTLRLLDVTRSEIHAVGRLSAIADAVVAKPQ